MLREADIVCNVNTGYWSIWVNEGCITFYSQKTYKSYTFHCQPSIGIKGEPILIVHIKGDNVTLTGKPALAYTEWYIEQQLLQ
jgi:hypothetical protein